MTGAVPSITLHASCVAWDGRGLLIKGAAGTGKSSLALQLMAFGCALVADDRTDIERRDDTLWASCPKSIDGLIEARGVGLLRASSDGPVRLISAVDLDTEETHRLPEPHSMTILSVDLPCLQNPATAVFPAAVLQYLKEGRADDR